MKYIIFAAVLALNIQTTAQQSADSCDYFCKRSRLWEFRPGDDFFFPATSVFNTNQVFPDYQIQTGSIKKIKTPQGGEEMVFVPQTSRAARYIDLKGKTFKIVNVEMVPAASYKNPAYQYLLINLVGADSAGRLVFTTVFNKAEADAEAIAHPLENNLTLPGAVYMPELLNAKQQLTAFKTLYILESPIDKAKFEPVTIVGIDTGSWEAPIRIRYRVNADPSMKVYMKDVNLCGSNTLGAFLKNFHFSLFFSCYTNPIKAKDDYWQSIRRGKITRGMTRKEVEFALGKLQKIRSGIEEGDAKEVYQLGDYKFTFEDNILKDIK